MIRSDLVVLVVVIYVGVVCGGWKLEASLTGGGALDTVVPALLDADDVTVLDEDLRLGEPMFVRDEDGLLGFLGYVPPGLERGEVGREEPGMRGGEGLSVIVGVVVVGGLHLWVWFVVRVD